MEPLLQLADLDAAERGARLLALGRGAVLVRVADATTGKGERTWRKKRLYISFAFHSCPRNARLMTARLIIYCLSSSCVFILFLSTSVR